MANLIPRRDITRYMVGGYSGDIRFMRDRGKPRYPNGHPPTWEPRVCLVVWRSPGGLGGSISDIMDGGMTLRLAAERSRPEIPTSAYDVRAWEIRIPKEDVAIEGGPPWHPIWGWKKDTPRMRWGLWGRRFELQGIRRRTARHRAHRAAGLEAALDGGLAHTEPLTDLRV